MIPRLSVLVFLASTASAQSTWYVDGAGQGPGSGTASDPFVSITAALTAPATLDGDTIVVLPGLYEEALQWSGKDLTLRSAFGPDTVAIDSGGEGPVIAIDEACVRLEGLTLQGGYGLFEWTERRGGGLLIKGSDVEVVRCVIRDCRGSKGAGIHVRGSELLLRECAVRDNLVESDPGANLPGAGGGLYATDAKVRIESCEFLGNNGKGHGGGVYASFDSRVWVQDTLIAEHESLGFYDTRGNGVYAAGSAQVTVLRSVLRDNRGNGGSISRGAGFCGPGLLMDCTIEGNANGTGGGVYGDLSNPSILRLERCIVRGNVGYSGGGVCGALLDRCTVVDNSAGSSAGGILFCEATNCILWGNAPDQVVLSEVTFSTIEGGFAGTGNLSTDPLFWMPLTGDLHLKPSSPCVDSGDPSANADLDGSLADQGALPLDLDYCAAARSWCVATASTNGCMAQTTSLGSPSISGPDNFRLKADSVRSQEFGWFLWSEDSGSSVLQGGTLCLSGNVRRSSTLFTGGSPAGGDCSGRLEYLFTQETMVREGLAPGTTIYGQFVHRDAGGIAFLGFSDALEFTLCP